MIIRHRCGHEEEYGTLPPSDGVKLQAKRCPSCVAAQQEAEAINRLHKDIRQQQESGADRRRREDQRVSLAGVMMAAYLERLPLHADPTWPGRPVTDLKEIRDRASLAVQAADLILAELDRTARKEES